MAAHLSRRQFGLVAGAFVANAPAAVMAAPARGLTVVELFTSQLCPGCPVADALLIALSKRPNLLPLSFSVTHYDRGAFKDPLGQEAFSQRQFAYARAFQRTNAFTPEIVVNGTRDAPGMATDYVEELLAKAELDGPSITPTAGAVEVGQGIPPEIGADVWVAHYDPRQIEAPIRGLDDRTLPHVNVVRELYQIGVWRGDKTRFDAPPVPPGLKRAAVLQTAKMGPILTAVRG